MQSLVKLVVRGFLQSALSQVNLYLHQLIAIFEDDPEKSIKFYSPRLIFHTAIDWKNNNASGLQDYRINGIQDTRFNSPFYWKYPEN